MSNDKEGAAGSHQQWVVDSIEDGVAALETGEGKIVHVAAHTLPKGAGEGSVLRVAPTCGLAPGAHEMTLDAEATAAAATEIQERHARLARQDRGGDLAL